MESLDHERTRYIEDLNVKKGQTIVRTAPKNDEIEEIDSEQMQQLPG